MQLLIIGTLDGQVGAASKIAMAQGAKVVHTATIEEGLEALRGGKGGDLVLVDVALNVGDLITSLEAERIIVPVVACGVGNDTAAAVRAIKAGAKEYVPLPPNAELIGAVLAAISVEDHAIVYHGPAMEEVIRMAEQVSASTASVFITGGSGTGKELMARYIHNHSKRKDGPFVAVNCAAIPDNLLESELFGHEKGAFTGAVSRRLGRFEEANGGTLLLDEISEMDPRLQAKLLRAIQEREIDRVGGNKPVKVDVRILATSNRKMEDEVAKGTFREDLYFRLNVVNIAIPPLSKRRDDILILAEHFVKKFAESNDVRPLPLSAGAKQVLLNHPWPGNVRELENVIHRAVLLGGPDEIGPDALSLATSRPEHKRPDDRNAEWDHSGEEPSEEEGHGLVGRTVADVERELIIDTLKHCLGNRTHAANILGISIRTLRNKLKSYNDQGFPVPAPGEAAG